MDGIFDAGMPMGFGMALAQNERAMERFARLEPEKRKRVIEGTRSVTSKKEMRAYVESLANGTFV